MKPVIDITVLASIVEDDKLSEELLRIIEDEMAFEAECYNLLLDGWIPVLLPKRELTLNNLDMEDWCRDNLQGKYKGQQRTWIFEKEEDAVWFELRWS